MNARILNRNSQPPADGWYQIEVTGEHTASGGRTQVIDATALNAIVNRFQQEKTEAGENFAGLLVDADHLSHDLDKTTAAFAWAQDLAIRNGQLHAQLDLTDLGEPAVAKKRFKYFSTEYDPADLEDLGNGRVRPLRLAGLAFTNRPNNRGGKPISNRKGTQPGGEPTPTETNTMQPIAELLGLAADADEAAILTAITQLQSKVADAETKEADAEAETILNTIGKRIPANAREHWKGELIKNREEAKKAIELSFPANPAREERIFNRKAATAPDPVESQRTEDEREENEARAIRNRAAELQSASGGRRSFKVCWDQAASEVASKN